MPIQLVDHAAAATAGHDDVVAHRLARPGVQHRGQRVATDQGIGVGHVGVGHIGEAQAVGVAERRVRGHAEAQPQRFGAVVDGHVAVILRVARRTITFGVDAFHRATIGPAHVQRALPDRDEVAVVRLAGDLYRGLGASGRVFAPGGGLRQDTHGTDQALLRLFDEVRRGQVEAAELDRRGVDVVHRAAQLQYRLAFTLQVAGVVLVHLARVGATVADPGRYGLHRVETNVGTIGLGDVVGQQLGVQADMAGRAHQVVGKGGGAFAVEPVTLDHVVHHRGAGQVRHHLGQAVLQGDADAIASVGPQDQRLHRYAGFQLAGAGIEVGLAHVQDGRRVVQRRTVATDAERHAVLGIDTAHQRDAGLAIVEHQGAAVGLQRPADMLADTGDIVDGDAVAVVEDVVGQRGDDLVAALDGGAGTNAIGVGRGFRADTVEVDGVAHGHRLRVVRQREQVGTLGGVVAHDAPDAVPVAFQRCVQRIQVVTVGGGGTGNHRHRCQEAKLLGYADHLR